MREIIQVRIWNPSKNKYEHSGGTPMMLAVFYRNTAKLFTSQGQEYEYATGLKDKNGKEIYEGDIVIAGNRGTGVVEWFAGGFITRFDTRRHELINNHVEIIGDIHTSPELLEKE